MTLFSLKTALTTYSPIVACLLFVSACYKMPVEDIQQTHQYRAQDLIEEWRSYSARQPLAPVLNDDYYAPYTPPIRSQQNRLAAHPAVGGYYYDPRVDNPVTPSFNRPYAGNRGAENPASSNNQINPMTNDLLYSY